jgi:hypothetical protein
MAKAKKRAAARKKSSKRGKASVKPTRRMAAKLAKPKKAKPKVRRASKSTPKLAAEGVAEGGVSEVVTATKLPEMTFAETTIIEVIEELAPEMVIVEEWKVA